MKHRWLQLNLKGVQMRKRGAGRMGEDNWNGILSGLCKIEGRRRGEQQRMRWLDGITDSIT